MPQKHILFLPKTPKAYIQRRKLKKQSYRAGSSGKAPNFFQPFGGDGRVYPSLDDEIYFPVDPKHWVNQACARLSKEAFEIEDESDCDLHNYEYGEVHLLTNDQGEVIAYSVVAYNTYLWAGEEHFVVKPGPAAVSPEGRGKNFVAHDTYSSLLSLTKSYTFDCLKRGKIPKIELLVNAANPYFEKIMRELSCVDNGEHLRAAAAAVYHKDVDVSGMEPGEPMETRWVPKGKTGEDGKPSFTATPFLVPATMSNLLIGAKNGLSQSKRRLLKTRDRLLSGLFSPGETSVDESNSEYLKIQEAFETIRAAFEGVEQAYAEHYSMSDTQGVGVPAAKL